VTASGHCGAWFFRLDEREAEYNGGFIFYASQGGSPTSPTGRHQVLAYVTVTNDGPAAVGVSWDDDFGFTTLGPGNSVTLAVNSFVEVGVMGAGTAPPIYAQGRYVISWCCAGISS
jgi:hypothetical protein